jgi:hypothetical protein
MELNSMALSMASVTSVLASPRLVALFLVPSDTGTPGDAVSTPVDGSSLLAALLASATPGVRLPTPERGAFRAASLLLYFTAALVKISASFFSALVVLFSTCAGRLPLIASVREAAALTM